VNTPNATLTTWLAKLALVAAALVAGAAVLAKDAADPAAQPTPAKDADPFPITVRAAPATVLAGQSAGAGALTISGDTLPAGKRAVAVTIASEAGAVDSTHQVAPDAQGRYRFAAPVPAQPGNYRVNVVAPDGRGKATALFQVIGPGAVGPKAGSVLDEALAAVEEGVNAAEAKIDTLTDSPAKDQAKRQTADAKKRLAEVRAASAGNAVRGIIGAISSDAALQDVFGPRLGGLGPDLEDTARETARVRSLTAEMSKADIGCQQLVAVTELFKAAGAVMAVKGRLLFAVGGLAKQYIEVSYARRSKAAAAPPSAGPSLMAKHQAEIEVASKAIGGVVPVLNALSGYVTAKVFGAYCEQFVGPIEGLMNARFFTSSRASQPLTEWWSYNYKISGRVILYYPKRAAGGGEPVRLNGRIEGYAHGFETWEDALSVMFPQLMAGALQRKINYPPFEAGNVLSSPASPGSGPGSGYTKDSVASLALPNSFLISVTGVLEKNSMTILLGAAQSDISATHRVGALILSPLVGGLGPQLTWYPLPFQKVRNFLVNAADGESMKLSLKTGSDTMQAQGLFTGKVDKPKAKGEYTLKVTACNPGC
jgi:hypothetical protein